MTLQWMAFCDNYKDDSVLATEWCYVLPVGPLYQRFFLPVINQSLKIVNGKYQK